jgi:WD40 repeat protein
VIWDSIEWRDTVLVEGASLCISLAFSPDGKSLASGLAAGGMNAHIILYVWDLPSGKLSRGIVDFYNVDHLAFSPDGLILAAVNGYVLLYQFDTMPTFRDNVLSSSDDKPSQVLRPESDHAFTAEYSPDGTVLATGTMGGDVLLWHVESAKPFVVLSESGHCTKSAEMLVHTIAFSWDGSLLASTICGRDVALWDLATRTLVRRVETGGFTYALDFSPGGKLLITGSERAAHIWDLTSGTELCTLTVDTGSITSIGFSEDANRILAASSDGSVIAWDVGELCSPRGPTQQSLKP